MFKLNTTSDQVKFATCIYQRLVALFVLALSIGAQAQTRPSIADLQARITQLEGNSVIGLDGYLALDTATDPGRPIVAFEGVNVRVGNGLGSTAATNGLGNLLIGYNEARFPGDRDECSDPAHNNSTDCLSAGGTWGPVHRGGSHNLVVGVGHNYDQAGGFVAGFWNSIRANSASVSGGLDNIASAPYASVSGGSANTASGSRASVSGGQSNTASGADASVSGGFKNAASGLSASVSGGQSNTASGVDASVSGGLNNAASGFGASVSGGRSNTASNPAASVSGGRNRTASDSDDWVAGGLFQDN